MILRIRVQPRARRAALLPWHNGEWKLCVTAPAVEGRANEACINFFCAALGLPRSAVCILSGETSRHMILELRGVDEKRFLRCFTKAAE